jgi:hypothetical protein
MAEQERRLAPAQRAPAVEAAEARFHPAAR